MKTIVRIGQVVDAKDAALSPFAVAMLAQAFAKRRDAFDEAAMVVEAGGDGQPVYFTIGSRPPELCAGDREVFAVFSPIESQEPVATFFDETHATKWAEEICRPVGFCIRKIDSTDRVPIHVGVAVVVKRGEDVLYCHLKRNREWALPEGPILRGESVDSAARRAVFAMTGIEIGPAKIPERVPYINAWIPDVGHFVTLILVADYERGELSPATSLVDGCMWRAGSDPPTPSFLTIQAVQKVLAITSPPTASAITASQEQAQPG